MSVLTITTAEHTVPVLLSAPGDVEPVGPGGRWTLKFQDEFHGSAVDGAKWQHRSTAESDWSDNPYGTGNPNSKQMEFDQPGNCSVAGGALTITARARRHPVRVRPPLRVVQLPDHLHRTPGLHLQIRVHRDQGDASLLQGILAVVLDLARGRSPAAG
ncbi:hypothetical protein [Nonomuraea dietziae]|uniref:hypothetical protein n=1 Tax=Nonomuraea dietziae TaxID=65515 RepID=UPI0031D92020